MSQPGWDGGTEASCIYHHCRDRFEIDLAKLQARADKIAPQTVGLGCPLNNLAQEMSPLDKRFRQEIEAIYREWRDGIAAALERGKAEGSVRTDVDSSAFASFMVATIEGSYGLAKGSRDGEVLKTNFEMLGTFLAGLAQSVPS